MHEVKCEFEVLDAEFPKAHVNKPSVICFQEENKIIVFVYVMVNCGCSVISGFVNKTMTKTIFCYNVKSPSGAITACRDLRKLQFIINLNEGVSEKIETKEYFIL
jgi:hypothetical protein